MGLTDWMEDKIKSMGWMDTSLVKLSVFALALMVAKLWQPILQLDWYWYAAIFVVAAIKPALKMLGK